MKMYVAVIPIVAKNSEYRLALCEGIVHATSNLSLSAGLVWGTQRAQTPEEFTLRTKDRDKKRSLLYDEEAWTGVMFGESTRA